MGLLDDAIREHLELKRKHGADPGEVDRQVEEALGAPQRAEFADASETPEPASDEEPFAAAEEPVGDAPAAPEHEPFDVENLDEAAPVADPDPAPGTPAWLDEEERDEVPAEESLSREPAPDPEAEPGAEDVLQDTPDFLQETPEHDRLWFEQRPPRDFDF